MPWLSAPGDLPDFVEQILFLFCPELDAQCLPRESLLIGRLGVASDFGERLVAGDSLDLISAASGVSQPRRGGLTQAVR